MVKSPACLIKVLIFITLISSCGASGAKGIQVIPSAETELEKTSHVGIPHEFIPKPGWCRVWYPDRSPGEQPHPERCLEIPGVPPGAWLVYGGAVVKTYRIEEYDPGRPGVVTYINYFELESGRFLRRVKVSP